MSEISFIEYDEENHLYYDRGELVPSITQTLDEIGLVDKDYFTQEHSRRGTLVHAITANLDAPPDGPVDFHEYTPEEIETAAKYAAQWVKLREANPFKILKVEHKVFCSQWGYAGRLDLHIIMPNGDPALVEKKTNKSGYVPSWTGLQLAAQGHALDPSEVFRRFVAVLTPDRFRFVEEYKTEDYISDRDDFLCMVRAIRAKRRIGR